MKPTIKANKLFEVEIKYPGKDKSGRLLINTKSVCLNHELVFKAINNLMRNHKTMEDNLEDYSNLLNIHKIVNPTTFNSEVDGYYYNGFKEFNIGGIYYIREICPTRIYTDKDL
jgi:hypothetical protein